MVDISTVLLLPVLGTPHCMPGFMYETTCLLWVFFIFILLIPKIKHVSHEQNSTQWHMYTFTSYQRYMRSLLVCSLQTPPRTSAAATTKQENVTLFIALHQQACRGMKLAGSVQTTEGSYSRLENTFWLK